MPEAAPSRPTSGLSSSPLPLSRIPPEQVESLARAYLAACHADAHLALRSVITEALAELCEVERRGRRETRLISQGYVRAGLA